MKNQLITTLAVLMSLTVATQTITACGPSGKKRESIRQGSGRDDKPDPNADKPVCATERTTNCRPASSSNRNGGTTNGGNNAGTEGSKGNEGSQAIHLNNAQLTATRNQTASNFTLNAGLDQSPIASILRNSERIFVNQLEKVDDETISTFQLLSASVMINRNIKGTEGNSTQNELLKFFLNFQLNGDADDRKLSLDRTEASKLPGAVPFELGVQLPLFRRIEIDFETNILTAQDKVTVASLISREKAENAELNFRYNEQISDTEFSLVSDEDADDNKIYKIDSIGSVIVTSTDLQNQGHENHRLLLNIEQSLDDGNTVVTTLLVFSRLTTD